MRFDVVLVYIAGVVRTLARDVNQAVMHDQRGDHLLAVRRLAVVIQLLHSRIRCRSLARKHGRADPQTRKKRSCPKGKFATGKKVGAHSTSPVSEFLLRQSKTENVAARRNRYVLLAKTRIAHRRSVHTLSCVEVPERLASLGIYRFKGIGIVAEEHQATRRGHRAARRVARADLRILPGKLVGLKIVSQQELVRLLSRNVLRTGRIEGLPFLEL